MPFGNGVSAKGSVLVTSIAPNPPNKVFFAFTGSAAASYLYKGFIALEYFDGVDTRYQEFGKPIWQNGVTIQVTGLGTVATGQSYDLILYSPYDGLTFKWAY